MAKSETATARLPRGTKPVIQAFLNALDEVPETLRPAVARAAQTAIRDELKSRQATRKPAGVKARTPAKPPAKAPSKAATAPAGKSIPKKLGAKKVGPKSRAAVMELES